ncbi:hypothetical protein A9G24_08185 [Gilliamella sp. App6-5]|uniref:hypothetical protein n=1 Tax=Gilliamella sp. App6-5 TaxID=3120232 RepID=UPI00080DA7DD|nr:hypothetical protein [Gilliamella apicola]OCG13116.1 hypothetical protein A9G24_08185 [Gilliamella apicola]
MLEIVTYLSWQVSHNYKHLVVLFFVSIFCLFYWYYCKAKPVLHYIIPILFFMTCHIHDAGALSATTADVIHGHAPYLTFDGGATKSDIKALFGIKLPDGREYVPEGGESNLYPNAKVVINEYEPIELPSNANTFDSIQTLVPLSDSSIDLNDLIGGNDYWSDDDGDGNVSITGRLELAWYDVNDEYITDTTSNFDPCSAPYQLELYLTNPQLSTQYGVPKTRSLPDVWQTYRFKVTNEARVCYAQPPDLYGMSGTNWSRGLGFQVKNIDNPEQNFPTTGSNELSFRLMLGGITPKQVIDANGTTVSAVSGGQSVTLLLSIETGLGLDDYDEELLKITLKGPNKDSSNKSFNPSLFKLYADGSHNKLLYSFKIERWYIANPDDSNDGSYAEAQIFCNSLGNDYRIPSVGDYTNANNSSWQWGEPGQENESLRQLSYKSGNKWIGGLFNEWGEFTYDNNRNDHWSDDQYWAFDGYTVSPYGDIASNNNIYTFAMAACVTP